VPFVRLDAAPAHCGLINIATLTTRPPPEPLDYSRTPGRIPSESRNRSSASEHLLSRAQVRVHSSHFSPHQLASSQHQTTHCVFPPLTYPFTSPSSLSDVVNQYSCHHAAVVRPPFTFWSLFSILTNFFLSLLCKDVYPCTLYTDIRATARVRTTRVYIPALLLVEEGMAF
jgi:hypothetical protein